MGCWMTSPKRWTVLGLLRRVLQTISIATSLFGSGLQDTCSMLKPTPGIHGKRWHSGWANQLSTQCSVCISYLQYQVCSTPVNIWSKSCRSPTNTGRFQFHIKVTLTVVRLYRASQCTATPWEWNSGKLGFHLISSQSSHQPFSRATAIPAGLGWWMKSVWIHPGLSLQGSLLQWGSGWAPLL